MMELTTQHQGTLHKLQKDKPRQSAVDTFRRKPYESIGDYEDRKYEQKILENRKLIDEAEGLINLKQLGN